MVKAVRIGEPCLSHFERPGLEVHAVDKLLSVEFNTLIVLGEIDTSNLYTRSTICFLSSQSKAQHQHFSLAHKLRRFHWVTSGHRVGPQLSSSSSIGAQLWFR